MPELTFLDVEDELKSVCGSLDGENLLIRNELHRSRGFRKIHLELAEIGSGLQIVHCVFFPDCRYDLPIFGTDVVVGPTGVSAAIVDLSPSRSKLPFLIHKRLEELKVPLFSKVRELPAWGNIFSPYVSFVRPNGKEEEAFFIEIVDNYLDILISTLMATVPDQVDNPLTIERYKGQKFYYLQQKRNDKTRNVLAKAFNPYWAERYIDMLLFDCPPIF